MSGNICRCSAYPQILEAIRDVGGAGGMRPFSYERAESAAGGGARRPPTPGARFLAGGTNLLDLMKLEIERPTHLIDVGRLPLAEIEATPGGGLRIGARGEQQRPALPTGACARAIRCWPRPWSPAPRRSCATRRPSAAT